MVNSVESILNVGFASEVNLLFYEYFLQHYSFMHILRCFTKDISYNNDYLFILKKFFLRLFSAKHYEILSMELL